MIQHADVTQARISELAERLVSSGRAQSLRWVFETLSAADRLASAAMWLVVHMTYARTVDPSGQPLLAADFKAAPEGHTGGSLNMVPAYVGYLLANVLTGTTRSWIMGQGHCVAAIEAVNVLVGNHSPAQKAVTPDPGRDSRAWPRISIPTRSPPTAARLLQSAAMSMRTRQGEYPRAAISASLSSNTCTCRSRAKVSSRSSATGRLKSSAAAIGPRAGGAPKIAASLFQS